MALPTSSDVQAYLNGAGFALYPTPIVANAWIDSLITGEIVPIVEKLIDQPLGSTTTKVALHSPGPNETLLLKWKPVVSVTSARYLDAAFSGFTFDLDAEAGILRTRRGKFLPTQLGLEITAVVGLNPTPPAVERAILLLASSAILSTIAGTLGDLASLTVVSYSEAFGVGGKYAQVVQDYAGRALRLLAPYYTGIL